MHQMYIKFILQLVKAVHIFYYICCCDACEFNKGINKVFIYNILS